jgi:mRNA-degrading endonuclease RelE of RelBE toxin-antitoxin system
MVTVFFSEEFKRSFSKIDNSIKEKIIKQINKLKDNPEIGKPMRYLRKGTRELYIKPFRLAYFYVQEEDKIVLLDFYHKDEQ